AVCFAAALAALPRLGAATALVDRVAAFHDRYVARGRCPADDMLDTWRAHPDGSGAPLFTTHPHGKDTPS
ncbi:ergothioneine biosynthesis glutamate--cysteine ligase EgtA, partial [Streptomyces sp. SID4956]|nr:ergothioneine biosynthesis glutamate--cysteine ligase EgtA [Streptomyces sp. SID4956]